MTGLQFKTHLKYGRKRGERSCLHLLEQLFATLPTAFVCCIPLKVWGFPSCLPMKPWIAQGTRIVIHIHLATLVKFLVFCFI